MNRNRFVAPPPPYNNESQINPINYTTTIPRFNVWQSSLSSSQSMQPGYPITQAKKNYCSTCDMWTSEPYNNHQISPAHLAKKTAQRLNQNYQPSYSNTNTSTSNNNNNNNNINNMGNNKRKYKRSNKRNNRNKVSSENLDINESNLNDGHNTETVVLSDERSDDKPQAVGVSSQSKESDKKLNITKNRGQEMLIPVNGIFCALCEIFLPNKDVAENEHCSSQAHCEAYEKLLKRVQESKSDKRTIEKSAEESVDDNKRLKSIENKDRDFRMLSTTDDKPGQKKDIPSSGKESDEVDRNSTNEFNAPDFSLEFPDDMEDYDEGDIQTNSEMYSSKNREVRVVSKDA